MNTTAAATEARVTTATIRTWCRRGVIAATKTAGKWVIDVASLARRIAIGTRKAATKAKTFALTADHCIKLGGRRWQRGSMDRIYFSHWSEHAGLELIHYNSGGICAATWQGQSISNAQAGKILDSIHKFYFDVADGKLYARFGHIESRIAPAAAVFSAACHGIRTAAAAL